MTPCSSGEGLMILRQHCSIRFINARITSFMGDFFVVHISIIQEMLCMCEQVISDFQIHTCTRLFAKEI